MNNILFDFIKKLSVNNIEFVVCGGVACILQGCERTTLDLDINVFFEEHNIRKLIDLFKKDNFISRIPEPIENLLDENIRDKWIREKNAIVYTVFSNDGLLQIDIFLKYPVDFSVLRKESDVMEIDGIKFFVSSKKHLIHAKENIDPIRDKDLWDLKMLRELEGEEKAY